MSRIKGKNTGPELAVRSLLFYLGFRFRLHRKDLPGRPDIVLTKHRTVVFVNGCYWHRHEGCKFAYSPKSRQDFWQNKFAENIARDRRNIESLIQQGWTVVIVWECELRNLDMLTTRLKQSIGVKENEKDIMQS